MKSKDEIYKYTIWFLVSAFISTILSPASSAFPAWLNTFIVLTSCIGLAYVDSKQVLNYSSIFIPVVVIALLYHSTVEPQYRYQGFYSDPNYLCTTLIVFIFLLLLVFSATQNIYIKAIIIGILILTYALILMSLSRTGLACSLLILLISSMAAIRKHYIKLVAVSIIVLWGLQRYASEFINNQWDQMYVRIYESNDNVDSAGSFRSTLSLQNIYFIIDNPRYIPFGLGGGTTNGKNAKEIPGLSNYRKDYHIDHNTWTSTFSEQGLICFILFFVIVYTTFNRVRRKENGTSRYLLLGVFISIILFSFSISQKTYLPFWWIIFFLNNKTLMSLNRARG